MWQRLCYYWDRLDGCFYPKVNQSISYQDCEENEWHYLFQIFGDLVKSQLLRESTTWRFTKPFRGKGSSFSVRQKNIFTQIVVIAFDRLQYLLPQCYLYTVSKVLLKFEKRIHVLIWFYYMSKCSFWFKQNMSEHPG